MKFESKEDDVNRVAKKFMKTFGEEFLEWLRMQRDFQY